MKIYSRLFNYAKPLSHFVGPYFITSALSSFFGVLNLALLIPVMEILFTRPGEQVVDRNLTEEQISLLDLKDQFYFMLDETVSEKGSFPALLLVAGIISISVLLANIFKYFSKRMVVKLNLKTTIKLRTHVFSKLMGMHLAFFAGRKKSDIINRVTSDIPQVQILLTSILLVFISEPLQIIFYFGTLFTLSTKLTLFAITALPLLGLGVTLIVKKLRKRAKDVQHSLGILLGQIDEALSGFRIIKAFNATPFIEKRYKYANMNYKRVMKRMLYRQQLAGPTNEFLGVILVLVMVLFGGYLVLSNNSALSPEAFIGYVAILSQAIRPIKAITNSFAQIRAAEASAERIFSLLDEPEQVQDKPDAKVLSSFERDIRFDHVDFAYENKKVLDDISFTIEKGKTVALVGPSGGGKTTISDLIPRFYDPIEGRILIDDIDLRDLKKASLLDMMGIVNQEPILFNDTVMNNIAFGFEEIDPEKVIEAAKIARAHDFILQMEKGYETVIGDRGIKLSGGQRQRLSIARAVMKDPKILILDEATSSLDTESEKLVQEALENLMKNRTSLVIAHRLSTIKNADKIIVIKDGKIVESGQHKDLIQKEKGIYKRLKALQNLD